MVEMLSKQSNSPADQPSTTSPSQTAEEPSTEGRKEPSDESATDVGSLFDNSGTLMSADEAIETDTSCEITDEQKESINHDPKDNTTN